MTRRATRAKKKTWTWTQPDLSSVKFTGAVLYDGATGEAFAGFGDLAPDKNGNPPAKFPFVPLKIEKSAPSRRKAKR